MKKKMTFGFEYNFFIIFSIKSALWEICKIGFVGWSANEAWEVENDFPYTNLYNCKEKHMRRINIVALILLALSIAMPASFTVASSNSKTEKSQVVVEKVNINSASEDQLREVPGIGPVTATKILKYREKNGNFSKVDELLQVKGIGAVTLEKMKPYISI